MANTEPHHTYDHHSDARGAHALAGCSDDHAAPAADTPSVTDPVCGMKVDPATSKHRHTHAGTLFHFCSARCREKFIADPPRYLAPPVKVASPVRKGMIYTCPMHPQIRQEGPGSCPDLRHGARPLTVSSEARSSPELADMTRRIWRALALTVPEVVPETGGNPLAVPAHVTLWAPFLLTTSVVLWAGLPFFQRAWACVLNRSQNMFSLIALGTGAAWLYSVVAALAPGMFPAPIGAPAKGYVPLADAPGTYVREASAAR